MGKAADAPKASSFPGDACPPPLTPALGCQEKKVKDPNAPKRALAAYMYFCKVRAWKASQQSCESEDSSFAPALFLNLFTHRLVYFIFACNGGNAAAAERH